MLVMGILHILKAESNGIAGSRDLEELNSLNLLLKTLNQVPF
jgi:hypothetical protein